MDARLQIIERAIPNHNEGYRRGRNQIPQVHDLEDEYIFYNKDNNDAIARMGVPRDGARRGRVLGRDRERI